MLDLPEAPARIARLPKDSRGYPVPWFVAWMFDDRDGVRHPVEASWPGAKPDFRCIRPNGREWAMKASLCWVCGLVLGVHRVFAIGPMCVVNRVTSEPPSHRECAEFAAKACPFLVRPRMRRLPIDGLPEGAAVDGIHIDRNPGCICLYETRGYHRFSDGAGGWLIRLGDPARVDWWAHGRQATRAEVMASIDSGYPLLMDMARREGSEAVAELGRYRERAMRYLPAEAA